MTNAYYANRDEYFAHGQQQPYTFEQYYLEHKHMLKQQYLAQGKNIFVWYRKGANLLIALTKLISKPVRFQ